MARDNFSKPDQGTLRRRVANRCSNPSCRVPTIGPATESDKSTNIGIAAHIEAASPKGPRFRPSMTSKQRSSIANGIWLCSNCATVIDRDLKAFPVELLHKWKNRAEDAARSEIGKKLPSQDETIKTLTAALTGTSTEALHRAIPNIHTAAAGALESLDPRFTVETSFAKGQTNYVIHANSRVAVEMRVDSGFAGEFLEKHKKLIEEGEDFEIDARAVRFQGSKLLESITPIEHGGTLQISAPKHRATNRVTLHAPDGNQSERFDDFVGTVSIGKQYYWFEGSACNGILKTKYRKAIGIPNEKVTIDITVNREQWIGRDVLQLAYVETISDYFSKQSSGWGASFSLEINGQSVQLGRTGPLAQSDFFQQQNTFFQYLRAVRIIATALNQRIPFTLDHEVTGAQAVAVYEAANLFEKGHKFYKKNLKSPLICTVLAAADLSNVTLLQQITVASDLQIVSGEGEALTAMGVTLTLPPKKISLHSVVPKILTGKDKIIPGQPFVLELDPTTNFEGLIEFC